MSVTRLETQLKQLQNAVTRRAAAEATIAELIRRLRDQDVPWSYIAELLGVTKQAAQQRYGR